MFQLIVFPTSQVVILYGELDEPTTTRKLISFGKLVYN